MEINMVRHTQAHRDTREDTVECEVWTLSEKMTYSLSLPLSLTLTLTHSHTHTGEALLNVNAFTHREKVTHTHFYTHTHTQHNGCKHKDLKVDQVHA